LVFRRIDRPAGEYTETQAVLSLRKAAAPRNVRGTGLAAGEGVGLGVAVEHASRRSRLSQAHLRTP
jgi:hypothetical protein